VPTEDRFFHRLTQGKAVTIGDVRRLGRYASHLTMDGHLFEFDQGRFWRTPLHHDEPAREALEDDLGIPIGPWYHHSLCDCELCAADPA
jgi:hypothetical protein